MSKTDRIFWMTRWDGAGLWDWFASSVSVICFIDVFSSRIVAMSRSMEAVVSLDDRFGSTVYVICLFDVF